MAAGSPRRASVRSTEATPSAGTSTTSAPCGVKEPSGRHERQRDDGGLVRGDEVEPDRLSRPWSPPEHRARPTLVPGACAAGSQSVPRGSNPKTSVSVMAAERRPTRTWTCTASTFSPGATWSSRTSTLVRGRTWTPRAPGASTSPSRPCSVTSTVDVADSGLVSTRTARSPTPDAAPRRTRSRCRSAGTGSRPAHDPGRPPSARSGSPRSPAPTIPTPSRSPSPARRCGRRRSRGRRAHGALISVFSRDSCGHQGAHDATAGRVGVDAGHLRRGRCRDGRLGESLPRPQPRTGDGRLGHGHDLRRHCSRRRPVGGQRRWRPRRRPPAPAGPREAGRQGRPARTRPGLLSAPAAALRTARAHTASSSVLVRPGQRDEHEHDDGQQLSPHQPPPDRVVDHDRHLGGGGPDDEPLGPVRHRPGGQLSWSGPRWSRSPATPRRRARRARAPGRCRQRQRPRRRPPGRRALRTRAPSVPRRHSAR